MFKYLILMSWIIFSLLSCDKDNKVVEISSPSGNIKTFVYSKSNGANYEVFHKNQKVINSSQLGIVFKNGFSLFNDSEVKNVQNNYFDDSWELPWGEVRKIRNNYNETIITYQQDIASYKLIFRVYDDGIAFRYQINNFINKNDSIIITNELTQFNLTDPADVWWVPAYGDNRYEELYSKTKVTEIDTVHTPLTLRYNNGIHLSIHEASLINYSSMQLFHSKDGNLNCDLAPWSNGDKVRIALPFKTPWRTVKISSSAKGLIESYLTLNCNEPNKIEDTSWIKPAKYIGIWWGMIIGKWTWGESFRHGATNERSYKYIDFASKHGFDEVLIEGWASGWQGLFPEDSVTVSFTKSTPDFDLEKVQNYAKSKGVSLQSYHETMASTKNYLAQIDSAFSLLSKLNIKNVKIGQVGKLLDHKEFHYGQYGVNYYRTVLEKALEYKIGVNFHEPIKDTGERRTYPHMLTREGAKGMEYNAWSGGNPPNHTTILPFTRLLNSPMDFTPGIFDLLYENIDSNSSKEYWVTFTVIDSGNGYQNLTYKGSESIWFEKNMTVDTTYSNDSPIYIWTIKQELQVGDWEWGVSADHNNLGKYDIWLLNVLKESSNRKIRVKDNGEIIGETSLIIPWQSLVFDKNLSNSIKKRKNNKPRVSTTISKQLALYVVIHSPLQMASDFIENYENNGAFQFIKDVPIDWDTTVVINGEIGEFVTIARRDRNSKDWYIGSITNEMERIFEVDLKFLDSGTYDVTRYADKKESNWKSNPLEFEIIKKEHSNKDKLSIRLAPGGGQAISLKYIIK